MRILVAPHDLSIGGSQINAIDLAAGTAAAGHDVVVYGVPGPLVSYIEAKGLTFVPARTLHYRPAPSRIAQLLSLVRREQIDLIHAYEWPPCLDAYFGAHLIDGTPLVCTVLSMSVSPLVPPSLPLIMGTAQLGEEARCVQRGPVFVLEPPIDTVNDHPGIDGLPFRRRHEIAEDDLLVVSVSRLAIDLKLDALVDAIDAIDRLAGVLPVRLVVVGGGEAHAHLRDRATLVNERWGREVVMLPGADADPRSAYAAADVVVGMGSSALRAMACGAPVVVQGERGFSEVMEPSSSAQFLHQGFWGVGEGPAPDRLASQLEPLLRDPDRRLALGDWGRRLVVERFDLCRALAIQLDVYDQVLRRPHRRGVVEAFGTLGRAVRLELDLHDPRRKQAVGRTEAARLQDARAIRPTRPRPIGEVVR